MSTPSTPWGVITLENWAEIRRLYKSVSMAVAKSPLVAT